MVLLSHISGLFGVISFSPYLWFFFFFLNRPEDRGVEAEWYNLLWNRLSVLIREMVKIVNTEELSPDDD